MWAMNGGLGAAYADVVFGDVAMAASFVASMVGCAATIALTLVKRRLHRHVPVRALPQATT